MLTEHIHEIHERTKALKAHVLEQHGDRDLNPHMAMFFEDGQVFDPGLETLIGAVDAIQTAVIPPEARRSVIQLALDSMFQAMLVTPVDEFPENFPKRDDKLQAIAIILDGYRLKRGLDEGLIDWNEWRPGKLKEEFESNPNSSVREQITTLLVEDDLCGGTNWAQLDTCYGIEDDQRISWDEDDYSDADTVPDDLEVKSAILDLISNFIRGWNNAVQ